MTYLFKSLTKIHSPDILVKIVVDLLLANEEVTESISSKYTRKGAKRWIDLLLFVWIGWNWKIGPVPISYTATSASWSRRQRRQSTRTNYQHELDSGLTFGLSSVICELRNPPSLPFSFGISCNSVRGAKGIVNLVLFGASAISWPLNSRWAGFIWILWRSSDLYDASLRATARRKHSVAVWRIVTQPDTIKSVLAAWSSYCPHREMYIWKWELRLR